MPDLPPIAAETYIGDGLYVSFDGHHIKLRAPRENGDHFVALERDVYQSLLHWVASYSVLWEHFATVSGGRHHG
jgi:hypothetical protein